MTVTSKGQFTLPAEARALMGVSPGDRLEFFVTRDGTCLVSARNKPASAIFGRGATLAKAVSESGLEENVAAAIAARGAPPRRKAV